MLRVALIFLSMLAVLTGLKYRSEKLKRAVPVKYLVSRSMEVKSNFTVFIPDSLYFEEEIVNQNRLSVIFLYINDICFCYNRPLDSSRNEYYLDKDCGADLDSMSLKKGDRIELDFMLSNLRQRNVVAIKGEVLL